MSPIWQAIRDLITRGDLKISNHGYDELAADGILAMDVVEGAQGAEVIEDYPNYPKGPCVLVLQRNASGQPVHVLWGIPRGHSSPAVLVTAYRPDTLRWEQDFKRRKP
ncbi:MAG TPA: DUF4258 domain-containing protein [Thermoanaerobaculia bacterium]|nr:DUF4258 domain-containing protein [Thermoanaerobaculia bacterium]